MLLKYASGLLLKTFQPFLVVGIIFHILYHLLMCIITLNPIEKIALLEKRESNKYY